MIKNSDLLKINMSALLAPVKTSKAFTLVELVITLAIGSIVLVVLVQLLTNGFLYNLIGFSSFNTQADAASSLNRVAKEIRQGPAVVDASPQSITILEYLNVTDDAPYKVRFFLSGTTLKRGQIAPTGSGPNYTYDSTTETFKDLVYNVKNGASAIFQYYDSSTTLMSSPVVVGNVTLVKVTLKLGDSKLKTSFTATTEVQLRFRKTNL